MVYLWLLVKCTTGGRTFTTGTVITILKLSRASQLEIAWYYLYIF